MNRTLANLRGVLLDGRHPFFMSGEFRISSNTLFPMTAACILHQIRCILHQIRCILGCKEILFHPFLGGYNYLTCSLFRVLRALYEVVFSVGIGKMPVFGVFFTIRWRSLKRDIQQIEVYSIPFCYKMCRYFIFSLYLCSRNAWVTIHHFEPTWHDSWLIFLMEGTRCQDCLSCLADAPAISAEW